MRRPAPGGAIGGARSGIGLARRYWRFVVGSGASAIGTYAVFLALAHSAALRDLGTFGLCSVVAAMVVNFVITVTEQRLVQHSVATGLPSGDVLRSATAARLLVLFVSAIATAAGVAVVGAGAAVATATGAGVLAHGAYGVVLGTRIVGHDPGAQLRLQVAGLVCALGATAALAMTQLHLGAATMLVIVAAVRIVPTLPALYLDLRASRTGEHMRTSLSQALLAPAARRHTAHLAGVQAGNAVLSGLDTLLISAAGAVAVAAYQLAQKPMQALSVLNASLGQAAFHHGASAAGRSFAVRAILRLGTVMTLGWTTLSVPAGAFARATAPDGVELPWLLFLSFGLAAGLSSVPAITGPLLIVHGRSQDVLLSTVAQLVVLGLVGVGAVSVFGMLGIAPALVAARLSAAVLQTWRLAALGRKLTSAAVPVVRLQPVASGV